ncbi:MAG: glycosyltransferase family 4 protein [Rhodopseudomonas palustris]|uniref:Glycosyltransferase family 4 protein n=1 Tax=Rhodopseudomonas palustris TaxID=1076 RepID=A0A933W3T7_RHOPL|nr:glycosyltransferase family 4 protein [Rhodopseudomonas palustris]
MEIDQADGNRLQTIVVDLTPVRPGGENGGAKVFVLELIRRLGELAPQTEFVLLTQRAAHDELAALDSHNIRRLVTVDRASLPAVLPLGGRLFSAIQRRLPNRLRGFAGQFRYRLVSALKTRRTGGLLQSLKADLLFCPFTAPTYFDPAVPTVSTVYDFQYKAYPAFFEPEDVASRNRTFVEAARKATHLVAISDYTRLTAIKDEKVDADRISTIHLHVAELSRNAESRDDGVLDRLGLVANRYLIYPANFWKHKNHEMLLAALGIARHDGLDSTIRLVCTGAPGARQEFLARAARDLGLEDRVIFPGFIHEAELWALITHSAGVIFSSLYEGFGLPVIEALAAGVPVACSNVTSLPEVAGDAAILFDPRRPEQVAAAMRALIEDRELAARLVAAGKARAALFSDSRAMARQYWEIFERVTGPRQ